MQPPRRAGQWQREVQTSCGTSGRTSDFFFKGPAGTSGFEASMILRECKSEKVVMLGFCRPAVRLPARYRPEHTTATEEKSLKHMKAGVFRLALFGAATPASAQMTWTDQGFANVNVGIQTGSQSFSVNTPFELYGETGSVASAMDVKAGGFFEIAGGYKIWRNLAVGAGYTYASGSSDAAIAALVPDPLLFDQLR